MIIDTAQIELLESLLSLTDVNGTPSTSADETRIRDIQGTGLESPLQRTLVSGVAGIVTAIARNGFYFQDPNPDNDPQTSEGIFVFTNLRDLGARRSTRRCRYSQCHTDCC
jgi:predicted extracellular nuclease